MPKSKTKIRGFHAGSRASGALEPSAAEVARVTKREAVSQSVEQVIAKTCDLPLRYAEICEIRIPCGVDVTKLGRRKKIEDSTKQADYQAHPHKTQTYRDITFDFTTGHILHNGQRLSRFALGSDYETLASMLLKNRGRNFSYSELAECLGLEVLYERNRCDAEKAICTKFSKLNAKCSEKVFQCNDGYFVED